MVCSPASLPLFCSILLTNCPENFSGVPLQKSYPPPYNLVREDSKNSLRPPGPPASGSQGFSSLFSACPPRPGRRRACPPQPGLPQSQSPKTFRGRRIVFRVFRVFRVHLPLPPEFSTLNSRLFHICPSYSSFKLLPASGLHRPGRKNAKISILSSEFLGVPRYSFRVLASTRNSVNLRSL
jgi:hypothetical protein